MGRDDTIPAVAMIVENPRKDVELGRMFLEHTGPSLPLVLVPAFRHQPIDEIEVDCLDTGIEQAGHDHPCPRVPGPRVGAHEDIRFP